MHRTNVKVSTNVKVRTGGFYSNASFLFGKSSNVPTDLYFAGASIKNSINFSKRKLLASTN